MKKILLIFGVVAAMFLTASCKGEQPLFDLAVEAEVYDSSTFISSDINAVVRNTNPQYAAVFQTDAVSQEYAGEDGVKAEKWLDKFVEKNIIERIPNGTKWKVHVKGYIKYIVTVEIDKTWPEETEK